MSRNSVRSNCVYIFVRRPGNELNIWATTVQTLANVSLFSVIRGVPALPPGRFPNVEQNTSDSMDNRTNVVTIHRTSCRLLYSWMIRFHRDAIRDFIFFSFLYRRYAGRNNNTCAEKALAFFFYRIDCSSFRYQFNNN